MTPIYWLCAAILIANGIVLKIQLTYFRKKMDAHRKRLLNYVETQEVGIKLKGQLKKDFCEYVRESEPRYVAYVINFIEPVEVFILNPMTQPDLFNLWRKFDEQ